MLLSIIIPVYNAENYLTDCLESIVRQPFSDYELILIDDGSSDASGRICDSYAAKHQNVIVKHIENNGPSNARNIGIEIAQGDYIQFIDSDDELKPEALGNMAICVQNYQSPKLVIYEAAVLNGKRQILRYESLPVSGMVDIKEQLLKLNAGTKSCILHYIWNRWYKREIILANQIKFDSSIQLGEDFVFNCEYMKYCDMAVFQKEPLYCYFKRSSNSLTGHFRKNELERRRMMFQKFCDLYQSHEILDKSRELLERMEANITLVSMQSVGYKSCTLSHEEKKIFLKQFMESEYAEYIQKALKAKALKGFNMLAATVLTHRYYELFLLLVKLYK